jgi:hypothetical protein
LAYEQLKKSAEKRDNILNRLTEIVEEPFTGGKPQTEEIDLDKLLAPKPEKAKLPPGCYRSRRHHDGQHPTD